MRMLSTLLGLSMLAGLDIGFAADAPASGGDTRAVATSNAAINATIKSLRSASKKVHDLIQTGIVQCIEHAKNYGDCTGAARLVDAVPQSMRRAEIVKHFAEYSPIRVTSQGRGKPMKASLRKPDDNGYNDFNIEGVKANPWFQRDSIARQDERDMTPFNAEDGATKIIDLAGFLSRKAETSNKVKLDDNGDPIKDDKGNYVRVNAVEQDDRDKIRGLAYLMRVVGNDPSMAAQKLGLPVDVVKALRGVEPEASDTDDQQEQLAVEGQRAAAAG